MEILIIEGNAALCEVLRIRLTQDGYTAVTAATGTDALRMLNAPRFDAILLDWMLPDMDGVSVLRELRTRTLDTPVMLLSTRTSVADRVLGLDSGADDYLIKPFDMDECMARVRRMVRTYRRKMQSTPVSSGALYCIADLTVDTAHHVATRGGKRLALSAKECAILEYLAGNPNVALTGEQIERHVSPDVSEGSGSSAIPVYIHYLRRKIDEGYPVKLLHTVRNTGYMLSAEPRRSKRFRRIVSA